MPDGGVASEARGRMEGGGGVIASIATEDIPYSIEGVSCGGDIRGVVVALVRFMSFFRYSGIGSIVAGPIFEASGVVGVERKEVEGKERDCTGKKGMGGGGLGKGSSRGCFCLISGNFGGEFAGWGGK